MPKTWLWYLFIPLWLVLAIKVLGLIATILLHAHAILLANL